MLRRAPQFAENTDELLAELGRSDDDIIALVKELVSLPKLLGMLRRRP